MKKNFVFGSRVSVKEVINVINGYNKTGVIDLTTPSGREELKNYVITKLAIAKGMSNIDVQMALRNANGEVLNTANGLRDFIVTKSNGRIHNKKIKFVARPNKEVIIEQAVKDFRPSVVIPRDYTIDNEATDKYGYGFTLAKGHSAPSNSVVLYTKDGDKPTMYWRYTDKPTEVDINGLRSYYRKLNGISYKDAHNIFGDNYNKKMLG